MAKYGAILEKFTPLTKEKPPQMSPNFMDARASIVTQEIWVVKNQLK